MIKQIESWFLADTQSMRSLFLDVAFEEQNPESHLIPYEEIKQIRLHKVGRGVGSKIRLAKYIINQSNFSIKRAANHQNCTSAQYFIEKLRKIAML